MLIFDIDETMIHTLDERDPQEMKGSVRLFIPDTEYPSQSIEINLNVRPYLKQCLNDLCTKFQIIAFTASERTYADAVLDYLDSQKYIFSTRLYRDHCIQTEFGHIKDLRIIANR